MNLSPEVRTAVLGLIEEFDAADEMVRPTTSDEDWERDDEEAEAVADAYYHAARKVAQVFGIDEPQYDTASSASRQHFIETGQYLPS